MELTPPPASLKDVPVERIAPSGNTVQKTIEFGKNCQIKFVLHNTQQYNNLLSMKGFGEAVRELRTAQNLGLRETASKVGISPAYLSRVERGKEPPPSAEVIKELARVLAADPDVLFRLSSSTDPEITGYLRGHPNALSFLRLLMDQKFSSMEIERLKVLTVEIVRSRDCGA